MLAEAGVGETSETPERPLKRRRRNDGDAARQVPGNATPSSGKNVKNAADEGEDDEDDEDIAFEDVPLPPATVQTMELDSDEEEDDDDGGFAFEDVLFTAPLQDGSTSTSKAPEEPQALELNLTAEKAAITPSKRSAERRKALTKEDRERRARVHQAHLVCLLAHVSRRNRWCNDSKVHEILRPHLTEKMVRYLNPGSNLSQFGRTESLKNGLSQSSLMWQAKFEVTERGLRRALWAEDPEDLEAVR
jgi:xeroderma pigmentosum group C-complementing protein